MDISYLLKEKSQVWGTPNTLRGLTRNCRSWVPLIDKSRKIVSATLGVPVLDLKKFYVLGTHDTHANKPLKLSFKTLSSFTIPHEFQKICACLLFLMNRNETRSKSLNETVLNVLLKYAGWNTDHILYNLGIFSQPFFTWHDLSLLFKLPYNLGKFK